MRYRICWEVFAFVFMLLVWPDVMPRARAQVLFEQLPDPQGLGAQAISSTLDNFGQAPGFRCGDDFTLPSAAIVRTIDWWGNPNSGGYDFTFTFYDDIAGLPGNILHTTQGTLSFTNIGQDIAYSSNLDSPFQAQAGATYWISIFNQAPDASWLWRCTSDFGNGSVQGSISGAAWTPNPNLTFRLNTPEPTSLGLIGAILARTTLRRARNRRLVVSFPMLRQRHPCRVGDGHEQRGQGGSLRMRCLPGSMTTNEDASSCSV